MKNRVRGEKVWIRTDLEDLVEILSRWHGVQRATIRNTALVYGLSFLILGGSIPSDDEELEGMIELLRIWVDVIRETLKDIEREEREKGEEYATEETSG